MTVITSRLYFLLTIKALWKRGGFQSVVYFFGFVCSRLAGIALLVHLFVGHIACVFDHFFILMSDSLSLSISVCF